MTELYNNRHPKKHNWIRQVLRMKLDNLFKLYKNMGAKKGREWLTPTEIKNTRKSIYKLTQVEFAELLDISYHTYKNWECSDRNPASPSAALLHMARFYPAVFLKNRKAILKKINNISL